MNKKSFLKTLIIDYSIPILLSTYLLKKFIYLCEIKGNSMLPNLIPGTRHIGMKLNIYNNINRFDIVVINIDNKQIVKRIIGLENEIVEYKDNKLFINGECIKEDFLNNIETNDLYIKLNDNEYYCLGDNRNSSRDSRYYGPIKKDMIIAKL